VLRPTTVALCRVSNADGRYVVFDSLANNLVTGDTNNVYDVFVYDRQTGTTTCVSVGPDGKPANSTSVSPSLSADGRYVAFDSGATNLVTNDTNNRGDCFVYDRQSAITKRVSVASDGTQANANSNISNISANGRYVAFRSEATNLVDGDTNGFDDSFVYDLQTAKIVRVTVADNGTQANSFSYGPSLSGDGRYVVFDSDATNLVANDTNGLNDVFVHDRIGDGTLSLAVNNARTFAEGSANSPGFTTFTVQLSKPDTQTVTVNLSNR